MSYNGVTQCQPEQKEDKLLYPDHYLVWYAKVDSGPHTGTLQELHVGNNNIKEINAEQLQNLPGISVLDIRDNKISVIPDEIVVLQALERLDITNNDVSA